LKSITIATPFFNEEEGLDNFFSTLKKINELLKNLIDVKYLFIDDGSIDKTKSKLIEFKNANQNLDIKIFFHKTNKGYGKTLQNSIILSETDFLITYDSDCTYDYRLIEKLIKMIQTDKADIINVSYKLAQKEMDVSYLRKILSWGSSLVYKTIFPEIKKYNISVLTCSFRIYDINKIKHIELKSNDFNCCAELLIKSMKKKLIITEIAGENIGRKFGESKMKILRNIFNTLKTIILIKLD
tara:strand:+ start:163 stop:885 length:723 start_codon:yes stop_codon:yes gene_type:complete